MLPTAHRSPGHIPRRTAPSLPRHVLQGHAPALHPPHSSHYLRLVNIEDHTHLLDRAGYRYVSDVVSPSLNLLAEMCPIGSVDVDAPRLNAYQVMRCFDWPIRVDSVDHVTQRIVTRMHPLVVITKLLAAHPKQILSFRFGLSHTLYLTPSIDPDDYFSNDPMPFRYKRMTRYQPITFNHKDL